MPREFERCVRKVKAKGGVKNAYAVCRASMGTDAQIKARRGKKSTRKMTKLGARPK
jgi:hypothetical protein|tara:strand:+ start:2570 stop:2737 length:168 start_codon:yes stop_codon:yes gene_type:complete